MLDHIGLQVADVAKSLDFYLTTFGAIGMHEVMRFPYGETIVVGSVCLPSAGAAKPASQVGLTANLE